MSYLCARVCVYVNDVAEKQRAQTADQNGRTHIHTYTVLQRTSQCNRARGPVVVVVVDAGAFASRISEKRAVL